jgi:hypothetical protein
MSMISANIVGNFRSYSVPMPFAEFDAEGVAETAFEPVQHSENYLSVSQRVFSWETRRPRALGRTIGRTGRTRIDNLQARCDDARRNQDRMIC